MRTALEKCDMVAPERYFFHILSSKYVYLSVNYNTLIAQYLAKQRQPDIEIWSGNRI